MRGGRGEWRPTRAGYPFLSCPVKLHSQHSEGTLNSAKQACSTLMEISQEPLFWPRGLVKEIPSTIANMAAELQLCMQQQKDEVTTLKAIYGDEFTVHNQNMWESTLNCDIPVELTECSVWRMLSGRGMITVSFRLPKEYPSVLPHVSILCDSISGDTLAELHREANETMEMYAEMGEPCLQQIAELVFSFISEREVEGSGLHQSQNASVGDGSKNGDTPSHCSHSAVVQDPTSEESACPNVAVVHLDHMNNSKLYTKRLSRWSKECGVHCTLVDCGLHCIVGIVLGEHAAIDAFLRAWKTRNVDEDVKGRPCKEKMMKVLCRKAWQQPFSPPENPCRDRER